MKCHEIHFTSTLRLGNLSMEQFTPTLTDCRAKRQEHLRHYESLRRTLTEEQRKELEEVMDEQLALFPLEQAESFIKGFRLGAGIMMEVLSPPAK